MDKTYDFAIIGTGVAGLSLAYFLCKEGLLKDKTLLMLDQRKPNTNDKTWSFWHTDAIPFSDIAFSRYTNMKFMGPGFYKKESIGDYQYSMIRSIDFYQVMLQKLEQETNISWHFDKVNSLQSDGHLVQIVCENKIAFQAKVGFNSAVPGPKVPRSSRYIYLKQHFLGWVVRFNEDVFTANEFTIHDFDIPQQGLTQFVYILPYNRREALVEFTIFSPELMPDNYYRTTLEEYLKEKFDLPYEITHREFGVIPMTDDPFKNQHPANLINIGTMAGAVKPSTGYGFKRITHHARRIANALKKQQPAHTVSARSPWHYQWLDSIMLEVLNCFGDKGAIIFTGLFRNRSPQAIFRFLDEKANLLQIISIMLAMPYKHLFFISMLRAVSRKVFSRRFH